MGQLVSIQAGRVALLGPEGVPSGFVKRPLNGQVAITANGIEGDEQADRSVHGGADKAVYGYASESYALWRSSHPQHAALWQPGGVGENLTSTGFGEADLCIGDVLQLGEATLQITQPRQPCFKLALRFADIKLPKAMMGNGLSGWYLRVVTPGCIRAGDAFDVTRRPNPDWTVRRMAALINAKRHDPDEGAALAGIEGVASVWARRLAKR